MQNPCYQSHLRDQQGYFHYKYLSHDDKPTKRKLSSRHPEPLPNPSGYPSIRGRTQPTVPATNHHDDLLGFDNTRDHIRELRSILSKQDFNHFMDKVTVEGQKAAERASRSREQHDGVYEQQLRSLDKDVNNAVLKAAENTVTIYKRSYTQLLHEFSALCELYSMKNNELKHSRHAIDDLHNDLVKTAVLRQQYEDLLADFNRQSRELHDVKEVFSSKLAEFKHEKKGLQHQLALREQQDYTNSHQQREYSDQQRQVAQQQRDLAQQQRELVEQHHVIAELKRDLTERRRAHARLTDEITQHTAENARLQRTIAELEDSQQHGVVQEKKKQKDLDTQLKTLKAEQKKLQTKYDKSQLDLTKMQDQYNKLHEEYDRVQEDLDKVVRDHDKLQTRHQSLRNRYEQQRDSLRALDAGASEAIEKSQRLLSSKRGTNHMKAQSVVLSPPPSPSPSPPSPQPQVKKDRATRATGVKAKASKKTEKVSPVAKNTDKDDAEDAAEDNTTTEPSKRPYKRRKRLDDDMIDGDNDGSDSVLVSLATPQPPVSTVQEQVPTLKAPLQLHHSPLLSTTTRFGGLANNNSHTMKMTTTTTTTTTATQPPSSIGLLPPSMTHLHHGYDIGDESDFDEDGAFPSRPPTQSPLPLTASGGGINAKTASPTPETISANNKAAAILASSSPLGMHQQGRQQWTRPALSAPKLRNGAKPSRSLGQFLVPAVKG